jgi:hypothetical protein
MEISAKMLQSREPRETSAQRMDCTGFYREGAVCQHPSLKGQHMEGNTKGRYWWQYFGQAKNSPAAPHWVLAPHLPHLLCCCISVGQGGDGDLAVVVRSRTAAGETMSKEYAESCRLWIQIHYQGLGNMTAPRCSTWDCKHYFRSSQPPAASTVGYPRCNCQVQDTPSLTSPHLTSCWSEFLDQPAPFPAANTPHLEFPQPLNTDSTQVWDPTCGCAWDTALS